ncbi:MAG: alpha/beta hydrolase [Bdellovibrionota bacterium]
MFWYPYIIKHLEDLGYSTWAPTIPNAEKPKLNISLPFFLENGTFNEETLIIGHSSGCPTILSILENLSVKIAKAILVAGFYQKIDDDGYSESILQKEYAWEKIKNNAQKIILINSDNDPWKCDDKQAAIAQKNLDAELIVLKGEGHMGSVSFNQPYLEFPLLKEIIS